MPTPSDETEHGDNDDSNDLGPTWVTGEDGMITVWIPEAGETSYSGPVSTIVLSGTTVVVPDNGGPDDLADTLVISISVADGVDTVGIDIDGALDAYRGFVTTGDQAMSAPEHDWSDEYSKYAVDPVLTGILKEIAGRAARGTKVIGHTKFTSEVVAVEKTRVDLRTCADSKGAESVDAETGAVMRAGDRLARIQEVTVVASDGTWFVQDVVPQWDQPC